MATIKTDDSTALNRFLMLASIGVVLTGLYFAQEVLIPIALAILLSFLLAPLVHRLEKLKFPRALAVTGAVLLSFAIVGGIGYVVYDQAGDLKQDLHTYQDNIKAKIQSLHGPGGVLTWIRSARADVKQALTAPTTQVSNTNSADRPQRVEVVNTEEGSSSLGETPLDLLRPIGGFLLGPAGTAFIVIVFSIFMLLQREDLRDRFIRLAGRDRLTLTTQALDDAADRVSRYLLLQSVVNGSVGILITGLLWMIGRMNGKPFPAVALWGLLATLLRFIPYIGIWISAITPMLLALAVYPTAKAAFFTLMAYGGTEIVTANVVEPLLFGSSTGIATLAVLVAAAFWTWLWGPVGLLLSTPLTVCLVVMGKYVPQLEFLTILLAEEPALSPPDRLYQRLMALDQEEAIDLVQEYSKKMSLEELYDTVLLPALTMAEQDLHRGDLDDERFAFVQHGIRDIVDEMGDQTKAAEVKAAAEAQVAQAKGDAVASPTESKNIVRARPAESPANTRILLPKGCTVSVACLPAAGESDEIAAMMLGQLLELRGYCVVVVSVTQLASEMVETVQKTKADVVCVSALPPAAVTHSRYLCKRLQGKLPEIEMVVGLWNTEGDLKRAKERIAAVRTVQVASMLSQAIDQIHQLAQPKLLTQAG